LKKYLLQLLAILFLLASCKKESTENSPTQKDVGESSGLFYGDVIINYEYNDIHNVINSGIIKYTFDKNYVQREVQGTWLNKNRIAGIVVQEDKVLLYYRSNDILSQKYYCSMTIEEYLYFISNCEYNPLHPFSFGFSVFYFPFRGILPKDQHSRKDYSGIICESSKLEKHDSILTIEHTEDIKTDYEKFKLLAPAYPQGLGFPYMIKIRMKRVETRLLTEIKNNKTMRKTEYYLNKVLSKTLEFVFNMKAKIKEIIMKPSSDAFFKIPKDYIETKSIEDFIFKIKPKGDDDFDWD
jgi:hypothetical protein